MVFVLGIRYDSCKKVHNLGKQARVVSSIKRKFKNDDPNVTAPSNGLHSLPSLSTLDDSLKKAGGSSGEAEFRIDALHEHQKSLNYQSF